MAYLQDEELRDEFDLFGIELTDDVIDRCKFYSLCIIERMSDICQFCQLL